MPRAKWDTLVQWLQLCHTSPKIKRSMRRNGQFDTLVMLLFVSAFLQRFLSQSTSAKIKGNRSLKYLCVQVMRDWLNVLFKSVLVLPDPHKFQIL